MILLGTIDQATIESLNNRKLMAQLISESEKLPNVYLTAFYETIS